MDRGAWRATVPGVAKKSGTAEHTRACTQCGVCTETGLEGARAVRVQGHKVR